MNEKIVAYWLPATHNIPFVFERSFHVGFRDASAARNVVEKERTNSLRV